VFFEQYAKSVFRSWDTHLASNNGIDFKELAKRAKYLVLPAEDNSS
jgi:hypothetical protein